MCEYKVGETVRCDLDPNDTHVYLITAVYSGVPCTYDLRLTTAPFTVLTGVPQNHITDTYDEPPAAASGAEVH